MASGRNRSCLSPRSTGARTPAPTNEPSQSWGPSMISGPSPAGAAISIWLWTSPIPIGWTTTSTPYSSVNAWETSPTADAKSSSIQIVIATSAGATSSSAGGGATSSAGGTSSTGGAGAQAIPRKPSPITTRPTTTNLSQTFPFMFPSSLYDSQCKTRRCFFEVDITSL